MLKKIKSLLAKYDKIKRTSTHFKNGIEFKKIKLKDKKNEKNNLSI